MDSQQECRQKIFEIFNEKPRRLQMAAPADHIVAYTIGPIVKYIFDCVQLYFTNSFTNVFL